MRRNFAEAPRSHSRRRRACLSHSTASAAAEKAEPDRAGRAARPVRRLGRLYGVPRRQEGLFRAVQADLGGDRPPRPQRDAVLCLRLDASGREGKNEVSVIVGYPQKPGHDATATVGSANYVMYTQNDGAWVKNAAEEAQMVDAMRKGSDLVIKSSLPHGTKTTDTYSLKGVAEALDKVAAECK